MSRVCMNLYGLLLFLVLFIQTGISERTQARRKPMRYPRYVRNDSSRMTIANMTCDFFEQPLNHFIPRGTGPTYRQRYCLYDGFIDEAAKKNGTYPFFVYTGNESPLEQYINHTGLIWELAPQHGALVAFFEHRYEGQSLPYNLSEKCMSYSSTIQALADFVWLLNHLNPNSRNPVIAFGGSYGGMLSSWLRMKYPNMVAGAIAASAPIWGLPNTAKPDAIDTASQVVSRGIAMPYPPTKTNNEPNHCGSNMLASWPLMSYLGKSTVGREFLTRTFRLCQPLKLNDMDQLLAWTQSPWFDMAEGSFPYPSSYIPFSLHMGKNNLPAWPVQAACWTKSELHRDWGVSFEYHNKSDVKYTVRYGGSGIVLGIDWDIVTSTEQLSLLSNLETPAVKGLLTSLRDSVSVWFNITKELQCFNITPAYNTAEQSLQTRVTDKVVERPFRRMSTTVSDSDLSAAPVTQERNASAQCLEKIHKEGSWPSLCCNEDINMPITLARGMGNDVFWPPSFPRGTRTYDDIVKIERADEGCNDPDDIFGYPKESDPWGEWLNLYYGGLRIRSHSNIVFSNGLLDPWSAGGVYADGKGRTSGGYTGAMVQNITKDGSMIALVIEFGGHHTDLMYSDPKDPPCVTEARKIENDFITRWIHEWNRDFM